MKIKQGVQMVGLQMPMRKALIVADDVWKRYGKELVVTSALDGEHSAQSLHYYGYALDFRSRYFTDEEKKYAAENLRKILGSDYHVIEHSTHIHVEYEKSKIQELKNGRVDIFVTELGSSNLVSN
jgi:hypothetical protein